MGTDCAVASRFNVGDQVVYVGPGFRNGDLGEVVGVAKGFDSIYRYDVRFSDGTLPDRCFRLRIAIASNRIIEGCLTVNHLGLPTVLACSFHGIMPVVISHTLPGRARRQARRFLR